MQLQRCVFFLLRFNSLPSWCTRRFCSKVPQKPPTLEPFVIAKDGRANPSSLTTKDFLVKNPSGAYTTARTTCDGKSLFEWDTHIDRTASSVAAMLSQSPDDPLNKCLMEKLGQSATLGPRIDSTVSAAVHQYIAAHGNDNELKVTVLVTWADVLANTCKESDFPGTVMAHISPLPPIPSSPVKVEIRGAPRSNAAAKDSSWVAERAPLEAVKRPDMNELLLATDDGKIFEGSQTNFYAVIDGALHTADEGVLKGTVRRVALEVCEREGIPVVFAPPQVAGIDTWEGALISSTSRLLLPVHEMYQPLDISKVSTDADLRRAFEYKASSLTLRLRDWVRAEVEAHSTPIAS